MTQTRDKKYLNLAQADIDITEFFKAHPCTMARRAFLQRIQELIREAHSLSFLSESKDPFEAAKENAKRKQAPVKKIATTILQLIEDELEQPVVQLGENTYLELLQSVKQCAASTLSSTDMITSKMIEMHYSPTSSIYQLASAFGIDVMPMSQSMDPLKGSDFSGTCFGYTKQQIDKKECQLDAKVLASQKNVRAYANRFYSLSNDIYSQLYNVMEWRGGKSIISIKDGEATAHAVSLYLNDDQSYIFFDSNFGNFTIPKKLTYDFLVFLITHYSTYRASVVTVAEEPKPEHAEPAQPKKMDQQVLNQFAKTHCQSFLRNSQAKLRKATSVVAQVKALREIEYAFCSQLNPILKNVSDEKTLTEIAVMLDESKLVPAPSEAQEKMLKEQLKKNFAYYKKHKGRLTPQHDGATLSDIDKLEQQMLNAPRALTCVTVLESWYQENGCRFSEVRSSVIFSIIKPLVDCCPFRMAIHQEKSRLIKILQNALAEKIRHLVSWSNPEINMSLYANTIRSLPLNIDLKTILKKMEAIDESIFPLFRPAKTDIDYFFVKVRNVDTKNPEGLEELLRSVDQLLAKLEKPVTAPHFSQAATSLAK